MIPITPDTPIQEAYEDEFGRIPLSELISNSIVTLSKSNHRCTVYGIYGAWGEGKTSMMNLVESHLLGLGDNDNIIIAHFNPWQVGSEELLMGEFFKSICKDSLGDIRDFMKKYGDTIAFASSAVGNIVLPGFGIVVSKGIKSVKKALESCKDTLIEQKDKISKSIRQSGKHLLVFIDDLDRLDKEELHTVFRLIRQVADFDNTIYMVAMDVDMASKSISQYFGEGRVEDGRRFIDKIVQVPIALPVISKTVLNEWLKRSLRDIIVAQTGIGDDNLNTLVTKITGLFETKRDCIRYVNQLRFIFPSVVGEVNVYDFCLVEAIKVISQEAYMKILHNKSSLLRMKEKEVFPFLKDQEANELMDKRFQDALDDVVKGLTAHNVGKKIKNVLEYDLFYHNSIDAFDLIDKQRLQSNIYFDKFFLMAVPENLIPDVEMDRLKDGLLSMNHHSLSRWIDEMYIRYGYSEIQRATLRIIRKFDEDGRCKATKLFCEALSISELGKGYLPHVYNQKRLDVFVATMLIPRYMVMSRETEIGMMTEVDKVVLDETLSTIYQEAEFNYCMLIHYGVNKSQTPTTNKTISSFVILKDRFVNLGFEGQMKLHQELLTSFYSFWKLADTVEMTIFLTNLIQEEGFSSEVFINKFIIYDGDATKIAPFIILFKEVVLLLVDKVNEEGVDYGKDSSVRLFMANYKAVLESL